MVNRANMVYIFLFLERKGPWNKYKLFCGLSSGPITCFIFLSFFLFLERKGPWSTILQRIQNILWVKQWPDHM